MCKRRRGILGLALFAVTTTLEWRKTLRMRKRVRVRVRVCACARMGVYVRVCACVPMCLPGFTALGRLASG